jgi:hypothetical protein
VTSLAGALTRAGSSADGFIKAMADMLESFKRRALQQFLAGAGAPVDAPAAGRPVTHKFIIGAPPNLAEIIRDAELHRTQRFVFEALFHPRVFRALAAPGTVPGPPHEELTRVIFQALFHPQSLNVPWQRLDLPRQSLNVKQLVTPGGTPPRRL